MKRFEAALAAVLIFAAGCGGSPEKETSGDQLAAEVRGILPVSGSSAGTLVLAGRIKSREEVTVSSRLASRVTAIPVREGQVFRKGQTLVLFDDPEMREAVSSAQSTVEAAIVARDKARLQEARLDSLRKTGVASDRQLELAVIDRRAAEAAHSQASAMLSGLRESITLTVPFDGVVVRRHVDPGAPVNPGQPILDLRSNLVGEIEVPFPESDLPRLGTERIQFQSGDSGWLDASVLRVDGMTDFTTRTRIVHLEPASIVNLEPGAFARVRVGGGVSASPSPTAGLSIPGDSLLRRGSLAGVFVLAENRARLRWLRVGREDEGRVQVLAGLDPDEMIAASPEGLEDGRAVKVLP